MLSVPVYSKYLKTSFFYPALDGHSVFECMVLDDANGTCHLGTRLLVGGWCEGAGHGDRMCLEVMYKIEIKKYRKTEQSMRCCRDCNKESGRRSR